MPIEPRVRISDDDRDRTVQRLQRAFAAGLITREEMDDRLELAFTARSHGDLAPAVADLPDEPVDEVVELNSTSGRVKRAGDWLVPRRLRIISGYGGANLDLSQTVIDHPEIEIDLQLAYGSATIILPSGATANADAVVTNWGNTTCKVPGRPTPGKLHVRVTGQLGYGHVKIRYARKPFN
ncbi:hypothetical protein Aple_033740 [Acrocarpospora pleiomorpha]|uniref:DUF1707 domain-containing protein n=1 Tax=Acrocarpospora pleiomorpha TaxID=90975 RepID=A0A5M3XQB5_9ACTN|nr:DUF1707 domain-containing protein [Acrocarpospora pleiomorpha]GES20478.1 hypothetical protein Aple_033740 [Acrocarpospora pleiomorpha]